MVRPREDPWRLSPSLRPWEGWGSLMDLCGPFRPVGPPRSSCGAYVGRVSHCHCGSDRRSRHPVRLVWVNESFGCRTIAARTRVLILDTILAITNSYSTVPVLLWDLGSLTCKSARGEDVTPPPLQGMVLGTRCLAWVLSGPPRVCSKEGGEAVPRTYGLWPGGL